ncbi:MAG: peroxiredoxin [Conexivisphaerales archaeon]
MTFISQTTLKLKEGDAFPDVELQAYPEGKKSVSDYRGKWLVLYFYPRDDTPGCTTEACSFRDHIADIKKLGAEVVGVSTDDYKSHERFAKKYNLNFTLLSDVDGELGKLVGALREGAARLTENRVTFLIDPKGYVAKVYPKVTPSDHSEEIIRDLKSLLAK